MTQETDQPRIVGIPLFDHTTLLDFAGATQVFAFAPGFQPVWLAKNLDPVPTSEGVTVNPQHTFDDHPDIDILFVPGGAGPSIASCMTDTGYQEFIKRTAATASWTGSVCNGAFILAAAGELDGCTNLTTYWSLVDLLDEFPNLSVDRNHYDRCSIDMDRKRFTGGGVSASIDLALELVKIISGRESAELASLLIQYSPNPSVDSGDPNRMNDSKRVAAIVERQQSALIEPVTTAVRGFLGTS